MSEEQEHEGEPIVSDFADALKGIRDSNSEFELEEKPLPPGPQRAHHIGVACDILEELDKAVPASERKKKKKKKKKGRQKNWSPTGEDVKPTREELRPIKTPSEVIAERTANVKEAITLMAACGLKPLAIASILKIKPGTIYHNFPNEMDHGKDMLTAKIASGLVTKALEGNVPSMIFYLKSQAGWRDNDKEVPKDESDKNISDVEKNQRLVSLLMADQKLLDHLKRQKALEVAPINVEKVDKGEKDAGNS